jgi:hypothetical protein
MRALFTLLALCRRAIALATLTASLTLALCAPEHAAAQSLDIKLDSAMSSGLTLGSASQGVSLKRSPLLLDFDAAFIFDGDERVEWVLGSIMQLEDTSAIALNPQVRLRRSKGPFEFFTGVGLPFYLIPKTRFGPELSFGFALPLSSPIALVGGVNVSAFVLGSDLVDNTPVFTFNGAVGLRFRF